MNFVKKCNNSNIEKNVWYGLGKGEYFNEKNLIVIIILLVIVGCDVQDDPFQEIDNDEVKQDIDSATDEIIVMEDNNKEKKDNSETERKTENIETSIDKKILIVNKFVIGTYSKGSYLDVNSINKDLRLFDKCFAVFQGSNSYNEIKVNNVDVFEHDTKHYGVEFDSEEPEFKRNSDFFAISDGDEALLGGFNNIYEYQTYHEAIEKMINVSEEDLMFTELIGVYDILAIFDGSEYYIVSEKYQRLNEYEIRKFDTTVYNYENLPDENINLFEPNQYVEVYLYSSDGGITAYNLNIVIYSDFDILVRNIEDFLIIYDINEDDTYEIVTCTNASNLAELRANYSVYKYTE